MKHLLLFALTFLFIATACKSTEPQSNAPSGPITIAQMIEDKPERAELYSWINESGLNDVWIIVDEFPELINGMSDLQQRVSRTVSGNPSAGCDKLSGERVIYSFVVNEQGNVSDIKSRFEITNECTELIGVTLRTVKFTSGKVNGKPVSTMFSMPFNF